MAKEGRVIQISYDVMSPLSYLALLVLIRYQTLWNYKLELNPTSLAGVIDGANNQSPMRNPNKQKKIREEIPMMARFFGTKCTIPDRFPFNSRPLVHFLKVVQMKDPNQLENISLKFYEAIFENKVQVENLDSIYDIITPEPLSREALDEYLEMSRSNEIEQVVQEGIQKLIEQGAFGLPWMDVLDSNGNHLTLFGSDRFEFLANWLGEEWKGPNPHFPET